VNRAMGAYKPPVSWLLGDVLRLLFHEKFERGLLAAWLKISACWSVHAGDISVQVQ